MKDFLNKTNNYLLTDANNYKVEIEVSTEYIMEKYKTIIIEYIIYLFETNAISKTSNISEYLIIRGLDTITHVFLNLLYYTKNIDLVFFHCEKSFYFYLEFVSQISQDDKSFLQLSSRDACIYVYKKTIYDVLSEVKKNNICTEKTITVIDSVSKNIDIYKIIFYKIINVNIQTKDEIKDIFNLIYEVTHNLTILNLNNKQLVFMYEIINSISSNIENLKLFLNFLIEFLKKIKNNSLLFNDIHIKKIYNINYKDLNDHNVCEFVKSIFA
jgi:hypothetical protein